MTDKHVIPGTFLTESGKSPASIVESNKQWEKYQLV